MSKDMILHQLHIARGITSNYLKSFPEEIADIVPTGFNNNIRWNFGHIPVVTEKLVFAPVGENILLPKEFFAFFNAGTHPKDWEEPAPSFLEIDSILTEQKKRLINRFSDRLDEKLSKPFELRKNMTFHTIGELLLFSCYHEAMHIGTIKSMKKAIDAEKV
jgi:hypothetical protein